jgi:hypothetical protein
MPETKQTITNEYLLQVLLRIERRLSALEQAAHIKDEPAPPASLRSPTLAETRAEAERKSTPEEWEKFMAASRKAYGAWKDHPWTTCVEDIRADRDACPNLWEEALKRTATSEAVND